MKSRVKHRLSHHFKRPSSEPRRRSSRARRKPGEWWKGIHASSLQRNSCGSLDTPQSLLRASALDEAREQRAVTGELHKSSSPQTPECLRSWSSIFQENTRSKNTTHCTSFSPTDSYPKIRGNSGSNDASMTGTPLMRELSEQNQTSPNLHSSMHLGMQASMGSYNAADIHDPGPCLSESHLEPNQDKQAGFPSADNTKSRPTFIFAEDGGSFQEYPDPKSESSEPPRTPSSGQCYSALRTCNAAANRDHTLSDNQKGTPRTASYRSDIMRDCRVIGDLVRNTCGLEVPDAKFGENEAISHKKRIRDSAPPVTPTKNLHGVTDLIMKQISPEANERCEEQVDKVNQGDSLKHERTRFQAPHLRHEKDNRASCIPRQFPRQYAPKQPSIREVLPLKSVSAAIRRDCSLCYSQTCTCIDRETNNTGIENSSRGFTVRRGSQLTYNTERNVCGTMKFGIRASDDGIVLGELTLFPMSSTGLRKTRAYKEYYLVLSGYLVLDVEDTRLHLRRGDEVEFCEDTVFQLRNPCLRATDLFCLLVTKM